MAPGLSTSIFTSRDQVGGKASKEKIMKTSTLLPSSISAASIIHKYSFIIHLPFENSKILVKCGI
jgi:hypothetical protein